MASSSSSSQLWNYDVFLSFRGEDTRKNFVDHLYTALGQQGIQTYKDDVTLPRGESIGPSLLKAIQESRIAVIVFSKSYADSSWCLDELTYIIECMDNRGQIVMPVFYDIDPSDVRKQDGKYEKALAKHEVKNGQKVGSWKKALVRASNLSGWVSKDFANGHEANLIRNIVDTIFAKLSPLIKDVNKEFIGIETRLQDLKSKLEIGLGGVRMVGIWGVGGGGKTTLASAAYMELSHQFEAHCLLQNIRDESRKHGLRKLQKKALSLLLKRPKLPLVTEIDREGMIKSLLCHKSVLLVLDDVDDPSQLEALAGSHDWFGEGSRIIITTRDENLLSCKADTIYEVSLLSHDEALKLFNRHAYRKNKPVEDYDTLSLHVVSYAGGLPLALKVLGSFLYDKDKDEWMSTMAKLKCIPHSKVTERLKISYDGLEPGEKELFLDIACFLTRWPIDRAMRVLDACSFHPCIGVKVLVQKSLIKVSNGVFDMHDLIQEMALYIVRGEHPNDPSKHSRVWQEKDIIEFCAMSTDTLRENNDIEVLALPSHIIDPSLPRFGLIKMKSFPTFSLPGYVSHPHLPDVVANMKKLRWLYWEGYPASSLPMKFQPTKLGCLMLIRGSQTQLWQGCKHLPNLKILDLRYSKHLVTIPDLKGLPCLEILILEECENLTKIHPSIGYHERLVSVNMRGCSRLKTFPPIIRMKKLETLDLSYCNQFQKFPDIRTNMNSLVNLHLDYTAIETIPSAVGQLCTNLVSFHLRGCSRLKRIKGNFRLLERLEELHLSRSSKLETVAKRFYDGNCSLKLLSLAIRSEDSIEFDIMNCSLESFPQDRSMRLNFSQFPRFIRNLSLCWCDMGNEDIPYNIYEFSNLQTLDLTGNRFSRLPCSLSQIPCLKFLDLSYCRSLVELPDLPSSIAIVKADHCYSLESLGDLSNYKWLWKVSLWRCDNLIAGDRLLHSMLKVNAAEDRFMSVQLPYGPLATSTRFFTRTLLTLQLPHNWKRDFSGFLLCAADYLWRCTMVIKQETSMDSQQNDDHWEEFDKNPESYKECLLVGYIPFGSLRHTSWWNTTLPKVSFEIHRIINPKVGLVPRKSKVDNSNETSIDCCDLWDKEREDGKTFEIIDDSKSKVKIVWSHGTCYTGP